METLIAPLIPFHSSNAVEELKKSPIPDFNLEHNITAPMTVTLQSNEFHMLDLNIGDSTMFTWRKDSIHKTSVCRYGNFSSLVSPDENLELKWTSEFNTIRVALSCAYVDGILQTENARFKTQCNFDDPLLSCLVQKLKSEKWESNTMGTLYGESLAIALVVHLASNYPRNGKKVFAPKGKLSSGQLSNLYEYARNAVNRNIKLSELAEVANMSEFHFARLFKQTTGVSPYRFVLQLKIDRAKMLIRKEKKSCSDVAYLLNFSDQAHFSHVFKKVAGCSPRSFMNTIR
jgi:AraC family transcriptional regulator